jgi:hypothetical protein
VIALAKKRRIRSFRLCEPLDGSQPGQSIGAIAHRMCQLIWMILHKSVRYEERGPAVSEKSKRARTTRMIRVLKMLGYRVELSGTPA